MKVRRKTTPRLERIRNTLALIGPATVKTIAEKTGISEADVGDIIRTARKKNYPGDRFRKVGKTDGGCTKRSWLYEISDDPDTEVAPLRFQPSRQKAIKYPGMTREEIAEYKRLQAQMQEFKPFRHWQDVAFFGAAP
ncbi:hypothetical protein AWB71_03279 [Caballeronia peredens]|nr:hypothetical protein AWB71_03279 [Caballeronia peredens]